MNITINYCLFFSEIKDWYLLDLSKIEVWLNYNVIDIIYLIKNKED